MNYYIQGDAAKADKIKAAFEELGINVLDFGFADKTVVYCSIGGVCVQSLPYSINLMRILNSHPDYKKLELPVEPNFKVGDWIIYNGENTSPIQIIDIKNNSYYGCKSGEKDYSNYDIAHTDRNYHLWSIADAKDGDVLVTTKIRSCPFIYRKTSYKNNLAYYYVGINGNGDLTYAYPKNTLCHFGLASDVVPATKEQRDLLFAKMKEAGYKWDEEKKELHKIQAHYDIANFKVGMPVLVRDGDCDDDWTYALFSHYNSNRTGYKFSASGEVFYQCIPFEGNKHLLGTTDMCDEQYINW